MGRRRAPRLERLAASGPLLVHFFDFAQLNSVRALPYVMAWSERYREHGLTTLGVHSPRFPFTRDPEAVAAALPRLGIDWPVARRLRARDLAGLRLPRLALAVPLGPRRRPALVPPRRGRLRGDRAGDPRGARARPATRARTGRRRWSRCGPATRRAREWRCRSAELFPGGGPEQPWRRARSSRRSELDYEAGGAYLAVDGEGEVAVQRRRGASRAGRDPPPGPARAHRARAPRVTPARAASLAGGRAVLGPVRAGSSERRGRPPRAAFSGIPTLGRIRVP